MAPATRALLVLAWSGRNAVTKRCVAVGIPKPVLGRYAYHA